MISALPPVYGLASRIATAAVAAMHHWASSSESHSRTKTGSAGWYNSAAFDKAAKGAQPLRQEREW